MKKAAPHAHPHIHPTSIHHVVSLHRSTNVSRFSFRRLQPPTLNDPPLSWPASTGPGHANRALQPQPIFSLSTVLIAAGDALSLERYTASFAQSLIAKLARAQRSARPSFQLLLSRVLLIPLPILLQLWARRGMLSTNRHARLCRPVL